MSARDAGANSFHYLRDFLERGHARVSGGGHGERAVGGAAIDGPLRIMPG